jgi:hypothetical protein
MDDDLPPFVPPRSSRDVTPSGNSLARRDNAALLMPSSNGEVKSLNGYSCVLTAEGGVCITYRDQAGNMLIDLLRGFGFLGTVGLAARLLFGTSLSLTECFFWLLVTAFVAWKIIYWRIMRWHNIEIHPDGLIIDNRFSFTVDEIGDNWPALQMKRDDPNRMVLCCIAGTRFIELATANRIDDNDRTPERLAQDLEIAMEQLWGRRDAHSPMP